MMTASAGADPDPPRATRPAPLTSEERRWVALAAPVAWWLGAGPEVIGAALVNGGLLGLAEAFVTVDRLQDRQCSRCRTRNPRATEVCPWCGGPIAATWCQTSSRAGVRDEAGE
jgi:hypothetical protein